MSNRHSIIAVHIVWREVGISGTFERVIDYRATSCIRKTYHRIRIMSYITWYYVNSRRHVESEKSESQIGFEPTTLLDLLYHWATGDSVVSKGQIVGIDWNRIAQLHSHVLAHMNSLTASRCHIKESHMNSLTASRCHIKACWDASNRPPKWVC